ncbi:cytochrome C [Dyella sp.]|jgi:cytochrome c556|uniref:cytochrome C n=1 Tax=Dyella sp. TaxID=1869338 RepID=UPI002D78E39C|nr:cytochrome C [Dyella sp.]HET6430977.1 cytochrome C [Dyella sp.]
MRAALLIALGLVIGILGTTFTISALHQRTPLPKAVMTVMAYHVSQLEHAVKAKQCDAAATGAQLDRLRSVAFDIPAAFKGAEQPFLDASDKLQGTLRNATAAAPTTCAALADAIKPVEEACDSCHKQYR